MEVKVVGGGIIGLSIAWFLSRARVDVTLHEAGPLGAEASWAAAGMLAPGGEYDEPGPWTNFALHSLSLYPPFIHELQTESGALIDFRRTGALHLAFNDSEAAALDRRASRQAEFGIPSHPTSHPGCHYARFYPDDALVNPRDIVHALQKACFARGVILHQHSPVNRIESDQITVLAAGSWSSAIAFEGNAIPASSPVRGHLVSFEKPSATVPQILRRNHAYVVQRASGELIAGSSSEHVGFDRTINLDIAAEVARGAAELLPELASLPYKTWLGFRPASETGHPVLGRHQDTNLYLAYGHYRNGILLAPATAALITSQILNR